MRTIATALCVFSLVAMLSCSGTDADAERRAARKAEADEVAAAALRWLKELPVARDIEVTAKPAKAEYEVGELITISVKYRNVGADPGSVYAVIENNITAFFPMFVVKNEQGRVLPNPYPPPLDLVVGLPTFYSHMLRSGEEAVLQETLNECVRIDTPGTYTVIPYGIVYVEAKQPTGAARQFRAKVTTTTISVRDYDRRKRAADIQRLVAAYRRGETLPEDLPSPGHLAPVGDSSAIVLILGFFCDPKLIPFFQQILQSRCPQITGAENYADYALEVMPAPNKVLGESWRRGDHAMVERERAQLGGYEPLLP